MVADTPVISTPLTRLRWDVESLARALFAGISEAIYVSTPITTGRAYFDLLRTRGAVSNRQREQLRTINVNHAHSVLEDVNTAFPGRTVIDPLGIVKPIRWSQDGIVEPIRWSQDDFNGFWMLVI